MSVKTRDLDREAGPTAEYRGSVIQTRRIQVAGHVQGVGFRPFVYRLAKQLGLSGWVRNEVGQVAILVRGPIAAIETFRSALLSEAPPVANPQIVADVRAAGSSAEDFSILPSRCDSPADIFVPPDLFTCDACLDELADPEDRRHGYAFINCTHCGPRFTLIAAMPYDRASTSMARFELCALCRAEYDDPEDRRFHAEPVACPECGPQLAFRDGSHREHVGSEALAAAVAAVAAGHIVAVKGVGGYHLVCDALDDAAVSRLRARKQRPDKPFAAMFPLTGDDGLDAVRTEAVLTRASESALLAAARPIVLVPKRQGGSLSTHVAPGLAELGVFLPYSPLHHLLLHRLGRPVVATSGNVSGEPVLTIEEDAEQRLAPIADCFLHHDRPIVRPADDPVYRMIAGAPRAIRLGRGTAPLELALAQPQPRPVVGLGGHMKTTVCLSWDDRAVISPHIGEMDAPRSLTVLEQTVADLQALYGVRAEAVVCDGHRDYATSRWARACGLPVVPVWHHYAHASALAGEHGVTDPMLVFAWDGVGLGPDGTLWGGETLLGAPGRWRRVASLRTFRLPGGDRAGREPWRSAAALCWESGFEWPVAGERAGIVREAWARRLNSPETTAVGRLFDAAAAIVLGTSSVSYEGQGPMLLEAMARDAEGRAIAMPVARDAAGLWRVDWQPLLEHLMDTRIGAPARAASVHVSLARSIAAQAERLREEAEFEAVGLSGGVFQNARLTALAAGMLEERGFTVRLGRCLPVNDAGLSFGQVVEHAASAGDLTCRS